METITQEDRDLLINDLCARLPFGIKVLYDTQIFEVQYIEPMYEEIKLLDNERYTLSIDEVKPYLFPLSSMTEEHQREEYYICKEYIIGYESNLIDFYNKYHYDYRGLIPKGLAIDATNKNVY
jgi:hypothetical protein